MATKQKSKKRTSSRSKTTQEGKRQGDGTDGTKEQLPPVIVGGGGSILVWVGKGENFRQVAAPANITYLNPAYYDCWQLGVNSRELATVVVNKGHGSPFPVPHPLNRMHNTQFWE